MSEGSAWQWQEGDYTVTRTCGWSPPGQHPVGWGLDLYVKDNKLVRVEGEEAQPVTQGRLGIQQLELPAYVHHADRIIYPMRRDPKDRGRADKWERITWDEAFDMIVEKTRAIQAEFGNEAIFTILGTGRDLWHTVPMLTFAAFRSPNFFYPQSGWSCYGPRAAICAFSLGAGYPEIDFAAQFPDRYDNPKYTVPECILVYGKAPLESNPDGLFGHSIIDMMKRGSKLIVVDPRATWLATRAEHFLQVRPGTDAALLLAMINVIIEEGLYDQEFVEKWCYGFSELRERAREYPPSRAAEITWVPEHQIIAAARFFAASKPATVSWGLAVDQNPNGVQVAHSLCILGALTGNLDIPGGIVLGDMRGKPGPWWGFEQLPEEIAEKRLGLHEWPGVTTILSTTQPDMVLDVINTGKPYPLKMSFTMGSNPLACPSAAPQQWEEGFKKLDFNVVCDLFQTPSSEAYCDLFLPVASYAEKDGIVATHYGLLVLFIGAINKALQVGECKSDDEIMLELGKRLNPEAFPWDSVEELLDWELEGYLVPMTFKELRQAGWTVPNYEYRKYETGSQTPTGDPGFATTNGRVQFHIDVFEMFGEDPLPYYKEPPYSPVSTPELSKEYPLILTTGARTWSYFHSEQRQIPRLREINPDPLVEIHPETAAKLGIIDGDWVWIENMFGKCRQKARLTPITMPDVVMAQHGFWYPEKDASSPSLFGVYESNINNLIPHFVVGKLGFGATYKCQICKVYKADGAPA